MVLTADQQNLRDFLRETIPLLCKSRLDFQSKFTVEAVIGLTIDDDDLFFVSLNENVSASAELHSKQAADDLMTQSMLPASTAQGSEEYHPKRKRKKVAQRKETPPIPSLTMSVDEGDIATNLESSEVGLGYIKTEVVDQHHESGLDESGLGAMPGMSSTLMDDSDDDDGGADDGDDYAVDDRSDDDDYKPTPTTATESEARTDDIAITQEDIEIEEVESAVDVILEPQIKKPKLKRKECSVCNKVFASSTCLKRHMSVHCNIRCPTCGKVFSSKREQEIHDKVKHNFLCSVCGKSLRTSTILREHMTFTHLKADKVYKCTFDGCNYSFNRRHNLEYHINVHNNTKPYNCPNCPRQYRSQVALDNHKKVCTNPLKLSCSVCDKQFKTKASLRVHQQAGHTPRAYPCDKCGQSFKWKSGLVRHKSKNRCKLGKDVKVKYPKEEVTHVSEEVIYGTAEVTPATQQVAFVPAEVTSATQQVTFVPAELTYGSEVAYDTEQVAYATEEGTTFSIEFVA